MRIVLAVSVGMVVSTALNIVRAEEDVPGVSDLTEPRPPATVTATNVATVVQTRTEKEGLMVDESEELLYKEPTTAANINTPETALPPAQMFDVNLDLEQTMEVMSKQLKALKKAQTTDQMVEPLNRLMIFASQAQALGGGMHDGKRVDYELGIKQLRINLAELESAVAAKDFAEATMILEDINENRKKSHEYFEVD